MERNLGKWGSSVDPQKISKSIEGIMKVVGGGLVFWGVASVTDISSLTGQVSQLVTLGYTFFGAAETAFGLVRKISLNIKAKF